MGTTTTTTRTATPRRLLGALSACLALLAAAPEAQAQEILLTGPLAGAPAVRKLRLYREGRFEVSPAVTFTLLDEYQRQILVGLRLNYNFTDWLAIGGWGAFGGTSESWPLRIRTGLSDEIQGVNAQRWADDPNGTGLARRLTAVNLGQEFKKQLGGMDWILAPQITVVPFRGKLALFQSIYVDSELYFFVGPGFVGMSERAECSPDAAVSCDQPESFKKKKRVAIAPTFGLGFSFFVNKWNAIGFEWRALPFAWNTGGFDTAGGGKDDEFPDNAIDSDDRDFHFNQLLTISYNFYFPQDYRVSE